MWIILLAAVAIGYLLGSINPSILIAKMYGVDIRKSGSGNPGATNTLRVVGKRAAIVAFAVDILKGAIAVVIAGYLARYAYGEVENAAEILAGLSAILGHNFPLYFGFKGGKGIATSGGTVIALDWRLGILVVVCAVAIIAATRYVSLGSVFSASILPVGVAVFYPGDVLFLLAALIICFLAVLRHKANIIRLIHSEESKIGSKKT